MQSGGADLPPDKAKQSPVVVARNLMRTAWKATLSTLDRDSGHPYGSLVAVATGPDGSPILLLSELALHTRNLKSDSRASLLFDGTGPGRDALTGPRTTAIGTLEPTAETGLRRRYLARHPAAAVYADFGDFAVYRLRVERAHLVAGFGRIERITGTDLLCPIAGAEAAINAEADIVCHMNEDHGDAVALLATRLAGAPSAPWQMVGCDPCGIDLVAGDAAVRLDFPQCITTPDEARGALIQLVEEARKIRLQ